MTQKERRRIEVEEKMYQCDRAVLEDDDFYILNSTRNGGKRTKDKSGSVVGRTLV